MPDKNLEPIAIIGMGAIMPEAPDKETYWQNILSGKNCITEVSKDTHWDPALFYSPDHGAPDKTYSKIGGFIRGFQFNSIKYRIPPQVAKQMDMVQCLAVETTAMALADAGYDAKEFDRARVAVIIGNAMGGMKGEMSNTRANAPFFNEIIKKTRTFASLSPAQAESLINEIRAGVNEKFLPITEDTMPGELSNVIAGRVANVFNLNGTNFTVDAACATSLAALDQAVNGLRLGNYDMAVCGGIDQMMSPSAFIKFSKIGALSEDGSYPFDARANGFVMAEGAGIVILKRLSDAVKDGDKIYCVVRAVGASSDGRGKGITAPNPRGQKLAVEKAFEQLDYTPGGVGLVEAHGTSTRVGDAVEVAALNETFAPHAAKASIGLGSIKSQIGHAKAAAGAASLIKTSLALHNKILPPSINFVTPNPNIDWSGSPFRVITKAEEWPGGKIRRANVSSFGFGGTNFHVALEEFHEGLLKQKSNTVNAAACRVDDTREKLMRSSYSLLVPGDKLQGEMLVFTADTKQELTNELQKAVRESLSNPLYIPQTAYKNHTAPQKHFGVVINVESPEKLKEKADFFIKTSATIDVWTQDSLHLKMKGIYPFNPSKHTPKVCFMFPGQGSQYVDMMKDLACKYKVVKDTFDEADRILKSLIDTTLTEVIWSKEGETKEDYARREEAIKQTQMTQPAVMTADVAMMRLLSSFGIKPEVVMGHSLGEYAAAVAAGIFDFENGLKSVTNRAKSMSNIKVEDPGAMASISAPVERVEPELNKISGYVSIANKNCPSQTVIAGEKKSVAAAVKMFTDMGIQSVMVPVSAAFHSLIIKPAEAPYRAFLNTLAVSAPRIPITSNVTADFYPGDPEKIKDLLVAQLVSSVEWIEQLKRTYDSGVRLFVECGPKRVLSAFAASTLDDKKDIKVLASNHPKKGGISEFNDLLANLTASGIPLDWNGTDLNKAGDILNPAYGTWALGGAPAENRGPVQDNFSPEEATMTSCNKISVVISGIAAGTPGSGDRIFREGALDEILQGRNLIEPIPADWRQKQIDKNVEYVVKSKDGNHRVEKLTSSSQAIKLSARGGQFDVEKEFGLPAKWVSSMDRSFTLAIAAGMLALKDAGIPLALYYKPTSTGGYLPDRWGLPAEMIDNTGIIFTSAFPNMNNIIGVVSRSLTSSLSGKSKEEIYKFYEALISKISDASLKKELTEWFVKTYAAYGDKQEAYAQDFLLKTIPIAHSHMAQWIRARGPATALSGACASTAQAVSVASDWIKLGRAKRVVVISADDVTNEFIQEWVIAGFLASGAATTEGDVTKAALPFDLRRNGMIVGMGAASLVVEDEREVLKRGVKPLVKVLETEIRNSGFHPTRLDVAHVADVMNDMVSRAEREYGFKRADIAKNTVFISHETYTPARGGSASAEVHALKRTFGPDAKDVIVSNTKGFTGHAMGAGIEDVIAVRSLNTGIIPPIANYKEPDPELAGVNLSKGGKYDFKYSLRLGAGFGSQIGMTLMEKVWSEGEPRIFDPAVNEAWLKKVSGQTAPRLEVAQNTLRIKDNFVPGQKPALIMEGSQAFVDKVSSAKPAAAPVVTAAAPKPVFVTPVPAPAPAHAPAAVAPVKSLDQAVVSKEIVDLISEKTGYPQDMLELDLDMEADLGIDTVKQAELFAAIREKYSIPQVEGSGIQLKDYPTINHVIGFVMNGAKGGAAVSAPVAVAAPAPVPAPVVKPAVVAAPAAAPSATLDKSAVSKEIVDLISEKTGYPQDMLELDLDMEADLGIDTVKQAELFAAIREKYSIPQVEGSGIQLKDYPTINHVIGFVMNGVKGGAAVSSPAPEPAPAACPAPAPAPVVESVVAASAPVVPAAPAAQPAASDLDETVVSKEIVDLISEKTGYPQDMLELDLDMEADLGIDTVKQAELFAAIREKYSIPQVEGSGIQLKDYPSIRHVIGFVMNGRKPAEKPAAEEPAPQPEPEPEPAAPAVTAASAPQKAYQGENCHDKKLRYVPTLIDAPLTEESARRLSAERPVLIFADSAPLIKAYQEWFKEHNVPTHVFTTLKARSKNTTIVNWESAEETEAVLRDYQKENPGAQGIIYLLGAALKKFDKKNNPHAELVKHVMPLFLALKVFAPDLSDKSDADTFFAVNIKVDASFGYAAKEAINPTAGSLSGAVQCFRKDMFEVAGCISKFLDFEPEDEPEYMAERTMFEVLRGDMRFMISYKDGRRSTILSVPSRLNKVKKNFDLAGKTIAFTGCGRGIGSLLSQKIAAQYRSKIIVLDIIEISEKTPLWAAMNEAELTALKNQLWADLKANPEIKATPVLLDKEFGKIKDSITLYKNLEKLRELGSEVEYYQCDVMNGTQMKDVVTKIKAKGGRTDGLIHFAGLERSKLVTDKTLEEFFRIFDVKATSGAALLALGLVKDSGFYAFASSIAGKYGNLGQSDYGSANDFLAKLSISLHNQGVRSISVAMSAFSNIGMGIRPGVETFLKTNGVEFVDPQDGMQLFLDEIVYGKIPEIVLTDALGKLDWDRQVKTDWEEIVEDDGVPPSSGSAPAPVEEKPEQPKEHLKENHFLGDIKALVPGQSFRSEKEYTLETDHYLYDHSIEGTPYVPGVMGLETFMEAAAETLGKTPKGLEDVHYFLPIKLLRNRPQKVTVKGELVNGAAEFEIESDFINSKGLKMGDTRRHFTARVLSRAESKWAAVRDEIKITDKIIVPKEEIYKRYFHGPSFQVLEGILNITENRVLALYKRPEAKLFSDGGKKLVAYPMLVEAAFQACGYRDLSVDNRMNLPDGIGRYIVHGRGESPEELYLYGVYKGLSIEGKSIYDAYVFDKDFNLWIELADYYGIGQ